MSVSNGLIKIGCCGFRSSRESYYPLLGAVEVQHTFYQPPQVSTLRKWRGEAPEGFEFTIKAWQLITHQSSSPTYRRVKRRLTEEEKEEAGSFRPTPTVAAAWELTRSAAAALEARAVLFQCPASFKPTGENIANLRKFFRKAERGRLSFCWEPRGGWPRETTEGLCEELDLWHVVDPFAERTTTPGKCYFRLHGRRGWRYKYEDGELEELYSMLPKGVVSYVFFNNVEMRGDAVRFKEIVESGG
ncbi:MAG TPA: DUF72 domain-containing protein [Pyrinomonadaceae bacterium]|jgi:uncharacterized protein YecE (DUF72 family)|nr:DUF72 domain-containing protein [Pyrinomonadaceae bacterium]